MPDQGINRYPLDARLHLEKVDGLGADIAALDPGLAIGGHRGPEHVRIGDGHSTAS
jgi:hypothetical protein